MPRPTLPKKLQPGDLVRLVSPASTPEEAVVATAAATLEQLGLRVEVGRHAFDRRAYLAGRDEDRLADFNDALADPEVRAVIATRGGKGAYRIVDGLDFAALRADPKLVIGFSEITILHLAMWRHCAIPGIHGAAWDAGRYGEASARSFRRAVMTSQTVVVPSSPGEQTSGLTTSGRATGVLIGGNLDMIATAAGWTLPRLDGAILLLEDVAKGLGHLDRQLTRLLRSGCLDGLSGIAVGQFTDVASSRGWTALDVLSDRLGHLGVPMLGGLPIGHGSGALAVPIGTTAMLDADRATLTVAAATR